LQVGPHRPQPEPEPAAEIAPVREKHVVAPGEPLRAWLWEDDGVRAALRDRDIGYLFNLLKHHRISQRTIARMVGMQQAETSEVLADAALGMTRCFCHLCRTGIPRHLMGFSDTAPTVANTPNRSGQAGP
jgi:hypothetical protein